LIGDTKPALQAQLRKRLYHALVTLARARSGATANEREMINAWMPRGLALLTWSSRVRFEIKTRILDPVRKLIGKGSAS
jgi:hypothetical protein